MIILPERNIPRGKILKPQRLAEWAGLSAQQGRQQRWRLTARLHDGAIYWRGWFDDRNDADEFLLSLGRHLAIGEMIPREVRQLPSPEWFPFGDVNVTYDFVSPIFYTSPTGADTTSTLPNDWSTTTNFVTTIGGGGSGAAHGGGAGGAVSQSVNISLTANSTFHYLIGGIAADTYFNTSAAFPGSGQACGAKGGTSASGNTSGTGGSAASGYATGTGNFKNSGGSPPNQASGAGGTGGGGAGGVASTQDGKKGGPAGNDQGTGGGACGGASSTDGHASGSSDVTADSPGGNGGIGPLGTAGGAGTSGANPGNPGSNGSGGGGTSKSQSQVGGVGSTYQFWDSTHGPGSGGAGSGFNAAGAAGGLYGGAGGGGNAGGGLGKQGLLVLEYSLVATQFMFSPSVFPR